LTVPLSSNVTIGNLTISNSNSGVDVSNNPNLFSLNQQTGGLLIFDQTADASAQLTVNGTSTNLNNVRISTNTQLNDTLSVNINNTSVSSAALLSGVISGSAGLIKNGSGGLTLSGSNTYSGGTTVSAGTLNLGHASNTLSDSGSVTVSGGTLALGANSDTVGAVTLSSGSITSSSGVLTGSAYSLTDTGTISAVLGGSGALTKTGSGTATLSGVNTYTGGTNINDGVLSISSAAALGSTGTISFGGGTLQYNGITTDFSSRFSTAAGQAVKVDTAGNNVTLASNLSSSGGSLTKSGLGSLTLSGSNTYSGGTTVSAGTLIGTTTSLQGNVTNNALVKFEQNANGSYAGSMSGSGSLTKDGSGTVTISGANTYSGSTSVEAGKLVVSGSGSISHSSSNFLVKNFAIAEVNGQVTAKMLTVENGGNLSGSGTITAETITVSGKLNPGTSPGTLTMFGSLALQSDAELNFDLKENDRTIGLGVNDLIVVNGNLTLDGTLNVAGGPWTTSGTLASPLSWRLFEFTGVLTNNGLTLGLLPTLTGTPAPQYWQLEVVNTGGSGGYVNLNAVPEPSVAGLLACALSGTLALRRRRRQSA
jgi:autotransporter-associated beta strand protein